jgi:hypothetical protein
LPTKITNETKDEIIETVKESIKLLQTDTTMSKSSCEKLDEITNVMNMLQSLTISGKRRCEGVIASKGGVDCTHPAINDKYCGYHSRDKKNTTRKRFF